MNASSNRRRRGASLTEVMIASSVSTVVLVGSVGVFLTGMRSWIGGQAGIDSSNSSQRALRAVANELREAMNLTVAGDGHSVTYVKPLKDGNGDFVAPLQADGYAREIEVDGNGTLTLTVDGQERVLAKGLRETDEGAPFSYFTPAAGSLTRSLAVKFASDQKGVGGKNFHSHAREVVYLRNVPQLSR